MGNRASSEPLTVEQFRHWWDSETHHKAAMPSGKATAVLSHLSKFTTWDVHKSELTNIVNHMSLGPTINYDEARRLFYRFTCLYDVIISRDLDEHVSEVVNLRPYLEGSQAHLLRDFMVDSKPRDSYLSLLPNDVLATVASLLKPTASKILNPPVDLKQIWRKDIYGHVNPEVHVVGQLLILPIHLSGGMHLHAVCTRTGEAMWQSAMIPSIPEEFGVSKSGLVLQWNHNTSILTNAIKQFSDFLSVNNLEGVGNKIYMIAALKNSRRTQQVFAVERAADGTVTSTRIADLGEPTGAPRLSTFDTPVGPIGVVRSIDKPGPLLVFLDKKDTAQQMHMLGWLPSAPITVCGKYMLVICSGSFLCYTLPDVSGEPIEGRISLYGYGVSERLFQTSPSSAIHVACIKHSAEVHRWNEETADRPGPKHSVNDGMPEISYEESEGFAPSADGNIIMAVLRTPPKPPGIVHDDKNTVYTAHWIDVSGQHATELKRQVLPGLFEFDSLLLHGDCVVTLSKHAITCFAERTVSCEFF